MEVLRRLRKTLAFGGLRIGMEVAQRTEDQAVVEGLRRFLLVLTRITIPLRQRLAKNMKLVGVYRRGLLDAHFERAVDNFIMMAHIFRAGFAKSGCPEKFKFDESFRFLEQAYAGGKGVICISPHLCGFPLYAPIVTPRIPCSSYLRRNRDPRKMRITEAVALAAESPLVYPPEGATKAQRLQVAIDVLREGKMLFITPDTPRKPYQGIPVTILGRTTYFPTGVFVMSMRTGAPVVPVTWHWQDGAYHLRHGEPIEMSKAGGIRRQTEGAMRNWAQSVDDFLHQYPEMWWNWLDKRWTRIIRNGE